jgi:hypothetical protein
MKLGRVLALVVGCLLVLPGIGMLAGGVGLGAAYVFDRDDGYFSASVDRLESPTAAITAEDLDLVTDPGSPDWLLDRLDADVRFEVTGAAARAPLFIGIGPAADVDAYLAGVAHDQVIDFADDDTPVYRRSSGRGVAGPPSQQGFWVGSATGDGTQRLEWPATSGRWAAVLMNADGSPGVAADATVGAKASFVLPLTMILLGLGVATTAAAVLLIVFGAAGHRQHRPRTTAGPGLGTTPAPTLPPGTSTSPVTLNASLDRGLSRWQWLVKWFLAIPHLVVLTFLWVAFVVLTVVAGVAILCTGRYPRGIFDFNLGVLRWSWRVEYYATTGGIGTDRYPPFSLGPEHDYPATLDVAYPVRLSRWLVLVKWLLGLPHYLIVALLVGGSLGWVTVNGERVQLAPFAGGLLGLLVLVTGVVLLVTGRYPPALYDVIVGLNRWIYRVIAYAALMTDQYPPFRLDQGGPEPTPAPLVPPPAGPSVADAGERDRQVVGR